MNLTRLRHARPALVVALVLLWYLAFTAAGLALHGGDPRWFIFLGSTFATPGGDGTAGYDGQFAYYLAVDPGGAAAHMDSPAYRYQRILYPMLARLLAMGRPAAVPWAMLLVNLLAVGAGVWLLGRLLRDDGQSAWWAAAYGLSAGLFFAYSRDLNEPLAYALVIAGLYLFKEERWLPAGLALLFAGLARETTALFAVAAVAAYLWQRRPRLALATALVALGPLALYQVVLWRQFGRLPLAAGGGGTLLPFAGLIGQDVQSTAYLTVLLCVLLPAVLCALACLAYRRQGEVSLPVLAAGRSGLAVCRPRQRNNRRLRGGCGRYSSGAETAAPGTRHGPGRACGWSAPCSGSCRCSSGFCRRCARYYSASGAWHLTFS